MPAGIPGPSSQARGRGSVSASIGELTQAASSIVSSLTQLVAPPKPVAAPDLQPMTANTKAINKVMTAYNNKTVCNWTENQFKSILGFIKGGGADMLLGIPDEMFVEYAPMLVFLSMAHSVVNIVEIHIVCDLVT